MKFQLSEYTEQIQALIGRADMAFSHTGRKLDIEVNPKDKLSLVFAGQYSAGKSTILRMLTGRTDIAVGAGITTQEAHSYQWNGLNVIDTPGIHTELRPDHDKISYEAIAAADMLVFVITNELFDDYLADHFRKLAIDRDKAGEMILVVNKMERASEGNTPAQQEVIRNDLRRVLTPYTPEQLNLCFLDAESYLDSLTERESDPELADELLERSGYGKFIETLNAFVEEKGLLGKSTTVLYLLNERLQDIIHEIEPQDKDQDIAALEEHCLQQRHVYSDTRRQLRDEINALFTSAAARIRGLGTEAADLLVEGCNQEEVEAQLSDFVRQAEQITAESQDEAANIVDEKLTKMGQHLEDNERSEFARRLTVRLSGKFDTLPGGVKKILTGAGSGLQRAGQAIADNAYKAGVSGGLKLSGFSGSKIHDWILKAGHTFGHKFKPWQAVKWTKGVAIGGRALGVLGVGASFLLQIKSDQDAEKARLELKKNRQMIRSQFNSAADDFEEFGREYIQECVNKPFEEPIREIDTSLSEIRNDRKNKSETLKNLEAIQSDCQKLINEIHLMPEDMK